MEQMNVPEAMKISMNFDDPNLSEAIKTLQPLVFKEDDLYCCVLGPDRHTGVFASAETITAALESWESNMRKRIIYHKKEDVVASFIVDKLNASPKDVG